MISIATGSNILRPGPRTWLAGCPWVSVNVWSQESSTPQPPTRESFTARGAFWRGAKTLDLGNAQTVWSFTTQIQFASFQDSAAFVAGLTDAGTWQGIIEWWVAQPGGAGLYSVYRAAGCTVQCSQLEVANVGITVGYRATFGVLTFCGNETVSPDVLGDGIGHALGDLPRSVTGTHNILGIRAYGAVQTPDDAGPGDPGPGDGGHGGGGIDPGPPAADAFGTGTGDDLGTGAGDDVLGIQS